ncbi:MAG: sigma-54-dependent Fis family transcriptional regulator [Deltaproteobacteria bacterium]|nr:sigma-54-dependent Fis family transcriptional regulator [Deltaproteobacteria bacterium]
MTAPRLLIVDDRDRYVSLAHEFLRDYRYVTRCELPGPCWECPERPGCTLTHAHDASEMDEALARARGDVDVVLLDVSFDVPEERLVPKARKPRTEDEVEHLRRTQGVEILRHLRRRRADIPVILMTAREDVAFEDDADALDADEYTYFAGADATDAQALTSQIDRVLARRRDQPETGGYAWGSTAAMARVRRDVTVLARTARPILLLGETGTGKSALAEKVIHPATGRRGPFVSLDIATIPDTLVAAELFGSARGAFSGAVDRPGRFEHASGGTLLLDEVGSLPLPAQKQLLTVLQDRKLTRLGEVTARPVDVKLVAATNEDLDDAVRAGRFRADLYMRLNPAARVVLPPLRDRLVDLPDLLRSFALRSLMSGDNRALLSEYMELAGIGTLVGPGVELVTGATPARPRGIVLALMPKSFAALKVHAWPGNLRELELVVDSIVTFALSDALEAWKERASRSTDKAPRVVPIAPKLVRDLLSAGRALQSPGGSSAGSSGGIVLRLERAAALRDVARSLERQTFEQLYATHAGDFRAIAGALLGKTDAHAARQVLLRFNQLGLRVRKSR